MMVLLGLPLGIVSARYRDTLDRQSDPAASRCSASARRPSSGRVILMLVFAYFMPLFPIAGRISDTITIAAASPASC